MESQVVSEQSVMFGPPIDPAALDRVDEMVRHRADEHPDKPAVRWAGRELTYRQLVDRAGEIADALARAGVKPEDVVAVQLPRCTDLVCVLLGVLQLGAIYTVMPLDWPVARRHEVLELTGARLCLSHDEDAFDAAALMASVEGLLSGRPVLTSGPVPGHSPLRNFCDLSTACCIFFTSGSTGTPKCAAAPHRGVVRVAMDPQIRLGPQTVMLQSSSMAWDLFAIELWAPLLNGGTTVLRASEHFSYDDLRDAVDDGVNTAFITPTVFNGAMSDDPESLRGLRTVFLGGERLSATHVRDFLAMYPGTEVFNIYGPVEATIWATRHRMTSPEEVGSDVAIGTPVPWTQIYLLDEVHRVVPAGQVGEIAIAGAGVALGYLGNPTETERRFRTLPLGPDGADVRVYLTGDFGRIDENGLLRFHGRKDRQVKIHGVRVEPHEVERVISALPGVAAVAAVPVPVGAPRPDGLAVVYATGGRETPLPQQVRRAVAESLPAAFVPKAIHRVDALPINGNSKVDWERIAELVREGAPAAERSVLTTLLVELEALTGVAPSVDSDVLDLGLTSINALKLINRMRAVHDVRLPMNVIFRRRTPQSIANWLAEQ